MLGAEGSVAVDELCASACLDATRRSLPCESGEPNPFERRAVNTIAAPLRRWLSNWARMIDGEEIVGDEGFAKAKLAREGITLSQAQGQPSALQ